jgi:hypothetical protein
MIYLTIISLSQSREIGSAAKPGFELRWHGSMPADHEAGAESEPMAKASKAQSDAELLARFRAAPASAQAQAKLAAE